MTSSARLSRSPSQPFQKRSGSLSWRLTHDESGDHGHDGGEKDEDVSEDERPRKMRKVVSGTDAMDGADGVGKEKEEEKTRASFRSGQIRMFAPGGGGGGFG